MELSDLSSPAQQLGPYQLGLLLGRGGMGEVYKAFDDRLGRWVAIKRLRGESSDDTSGDHRRERFRREARTLAQLGHPGIVQIFDIVQDDDGDCIVMELIDGPTLRELRRDGPLDPSLVLEYGRQIASALEAAHAGGVVHRDLKTENVMVLPSGQVKVLDFGIARRTESPSDDATLVHGKPASSELELSRTGRIVGTPRAMSPEQAVGREVDVRSDLFSLGVLLYEVLTARSPFEGRNLHETLRRVTAHRPPPIHGLNPKVPRPLSDLVDQLLEKNPAHRPVSAAAVEERLIALLTTNSASLAASRGYSQIETLDDTALENTDRPSAVEGEATTNDTVVVTTLLVSDLVGSTQLVEKLGDREASALFRRHDRVARDLLETHGGREIDKTDGFLLLFDRPWNAVAYALDYHQSLYDLEFEARVGIHLGEVVLHHNSESDVQRGAKPVEVEGLAKPTAARLMSLAVGGQTLLTRAAYEVARRAAAGEGVDHGNAELEWPCHGRYRFQGLADEVEVFEVGTPGTAPLLQPAGSDKVWRVVESPSMDERLARARADLQPLALSASDPERTVVTLRAWPPPELPEQPYPVLLPYSHPAFLAGRDGEISELWRLLEMPVPIPGLSAPSGTGKSSLLMGGLVPLLREAGVPVAVVRHATEAGIASRLIGDLLDGADLPADDEAPAFVERLLEVERLAGTAPVLVFDQFEDVLRKGSDRARSMLGMLMASSVARRPGLAAPPCRWLIAYRREFYGELRVWLGDVLAEARAAGIAGVDALPHDLSQPDRFHRMALTALATPAARAPDPLEQSTQVFLAAIETPLSPDVEEVGFEFPWFFAPGHAERLARAFAQARLAHPNAPLAPELQVVLAHLLRQAGPDGQINVPEEVGALIDQALDDHLRRALQGAFPADAAGDSTRRARALLALRELATSTGRREEGLRADELARAIGEDGQAVLERLATPLTRLVVVREAADGLRWTLSHDRLAEAVVRLVEQEGRQGRLLIDSDLLALRRFVTLRTELFRSGEEATSTRVSRRRFRRVSEHSEALLWDEERRSWFAACRKRRRADQLRLGGFVGTALIVLGLIVFGAWSWAIRVGNEQRWREEVAQGRPEVAFKALHELAVRGAGETDAELLALLKTRKVPMDVLEWGLGALEEPERSRAVIRAVEIALPWVQEVPEDFTLIANLVSALDFSPGRYPSSSEEAEELRERVLAPLRNLREPPPLPDHEDPDWIDVPFGCFLMGGFDMEWDLGWDRDKLPWGLPQHEVTVRGFRMLRHEVTVAQYRRLVPDHQPDAGGDLPGAYITWYAAYTYAAWLGGRLPTEAEWEYAARADCSFAYCTRDGLETTADAVAWTSENSKDAKTDEPSARPVMGLEPNPWGLYDMLGNLWEWTADGFGEFPQTAQSSAWGKASSSGRRVLRGGSFAGRPSLMQRFPSLPDHYHTSELKGFRAVLPGSFEPTTPDHISGLVR